MGSCGVLACVFVIALVQVVQLLPMLARHNLNDDDEEEDGDDGREMRRNCDILRSDLAMVDQLLLRM